MTATSGPGLSLMIEMIGLASMAEVPAVIVNVQRGGPSTGNPTRSEQSDLLQSLFGTHGDAPRVVLACADVEDCFHATVEAFNISEEFQLPVLVLSDQAVGQRKETLSARTLVHEVRDRLLPTAEDLVQYERYRDTATGVSPMAVPGMKGGTYPTNGLEHDEAGRPNSQYLAHEKMNAKRYRKMWAIRDRYHYHRRYGPEKAKVGIVCWGSSKGPVQEAVLQANANGESVAAFVPQMIYPFPKRDFDRFLEQVDELLVIELSYTAQFYKYLRTFMDLPANTRVFKRSGGKELTVAEVLAEIRRALPSGGKKQFRSSRGDGMSTDATDVLAPGASHSRGLQIGSQTRLVRRLRRLRRSGGPPPRHGAPPALARRHGRDLRHRLFVAAAGLRRDVRVQRPARPRPAARDRRQGRAPRAHRHRRGRRRRRNRDRRQPLPPLRPSQPRRGVHAHGQRNLRTDQGTGRSHDGPRREDEVDRLRQPGTLRGPVRARDLLRRHVGRPRRSPAIRSPSSTS